MMICGINKTQKIVVGVDAWSFFYLYFFCFILILNNTPLTWLWVVNFFYFIILGLILIIIFLFWECNNVFSCFNISNLIYFIWNLDMRSSIYLLFCLREGWGKMFLIFQCLIMQIELFGYLFSIMIYWNIFSCNWKKTIYFIRVSILRIAWELVYKKFTVTSRDNNGSIL